MLKNLFTLLLLIITTQLFGQILNGNFEDWEAFPTYDKPAHWNTNQDSFFVRFLKDTISYEGNYSLHAVPSSQTAWTECRSYASIHSKLDTPLGVDQNLIFYIRALSVNAENNTCATISGKLYEGDTFLSSFEWETQEEFEEYTRIEIPLLEPTADSIQILIFAAAKNGPTDGCVHRSQVWIDNIHIDNTTTSSTSSLGTSNVQIFPNPANGSIQLKGDLQSFKKYTITDALGRQLDCGELIENPIEIKHVGILFFILENKNGQRFPHKIFNRIK